MFHLQHFPADTYIWGVGGCYIYYVDIFNYSILRKSSSKAQTAACLLMILAVAERGGFHSTAILLFLILQTFATLLTYKNPL